MKNVASSKDDAIKGAMSINPKISRHSTFSPSTHNPKVKGVQRRCDDTPSNNKCKHKFREQKVLQKINMLMELKKTHTELSFQAFQTLYNQISTSSHKAHNRQPVSEKKKSSSISQKKKPKPQPTLLNPQVGDFIKVSQPYF